MKKAFILILFLSSSICIYAQDSVSNRATNNSDRVPVGTIIISMLEPIQFMTATDSDWPLNNPSEKTAKWAPADGRVIQGSRYHAITNQNTVPDLRGMFLRGLNEFEVSVPRKDGLQDPDGTGRVAGSFQVDTFESHQHKQDAPRNFNSNGGNNGNGRWAGHRKDDETSPSGDNETRPKNVAVYYYIKIN